MSEEERSNLSGEEEEVDDLFGDDDNEETTTTSQRPIVTGSDDEDQSSSEEGEPKSLKTSNLTLPRHPVSHKPEGDVFTIKMPVFLNVEAHPFDPNEFKERVARNAEERSKMELDAKQLQNDLVAEKLLNENTIRWRYSNSGNDEIIKQSNAHFVEWDDGSVSLKVGNELFDFKSQPILDNFLARSYVEHEVLQNEAALTRSANLIPASTFTETHRRLTQAVKTIQKKDKILNTLTERDPMLKQRMADENERKNLKAKRQLEQKRRLQEERLGKAESPVPGRFGQESAYERFERAYGADEYDDEDDFVANDDEELEIDDEDAEAEEEEFERGAERLKNVKDTGAEKYREESEEVQRKRRRIIDSDDDEE
ncbi:hypothetical protein FT663_01718 [Candidozyma haemuli var. vulneris]|uniref:Leo1-like protein n=1 Tax=Candidozyma haemuli TaxID=45357 RepID=A0A2V1AZL2_9ASCO|nr:hypothetical protein CXQ85_002998 [[Candida] haemuloni]KAF3991257.1 hypothetical protein FT662_01808 [[Candida] haemuloni var. vulneris]KAF3993818.1 hypothetical protein FT663_01718 [[Candida] haemuloni var. vulneris]PVH23264.1 hypothetical protein CXQ85_002998 [[Candida] haemuloni]